MGTSDAYNPPVENEAWSSNMADHVIALRSGRKVEVEEYGDRAGHPLLFFHGLIGSHHQASYVAEEARRAGLRIIAPNRPGVGRSEFVARASALEAVDDIEDIAAALGLDEFSVIGISGGAPYALAALYRLGDRIRTVTIISGMGPMQLPGALHGMERAVASSWRPGPDTRNWRVGRS